jgi:EAL domain-containing protein (putative c-di-GMP-specific phosphodiesterase class I)
MPTTPAFAAIDAYLGRRSDGPNPNLSIWRSADGSVQGQFFACTLTSEFQPILAFGRHAGSRPVAFEGVARGVSPSDQGLSVWRMLDGASSDKESIELDRVCRVLHAINYFRQSPAAADADLYLSVHDRLLAAVSSNHGDAFLRMLNVLELHAERIVLQLPAIGPASRWMAHYVADNYRRNGFRLALTAVRVKDAIDLVGQFRPHAIVLDARALRNAALLSQLLILAQASKVVVTIKKVETAETLALLGQVCRATGTVVHAQGDWIARPQPLLQRRYVNPIELATASIA